MYVDQKKKFCQVGLTHTKANSKLLLSYETLRKSIFLDPSP